MASVFRPVLLLLSLDSLTLGEATLCQKNTQGAYGKTIASEERTSNRRNDLEADAPLVEISDETIAPAEGLTAAS